MILTSNRPYLALALVAGASAACSRPEARPAANPRDSIQLSAALLSPTDVKLTWKDSAPNAAGHIVEYATEPQGEFTTLGFLSPEQDTFTHPDLMPETTWYYRVRAYYGPTSNRVEVVLPAGLSDAEYTARYALPEDYSWAAPQIVPEGVKALKKSIRGRAAIEAAPTDLKATLVPSTVSGFRLTWTDHASDEDGYLVEMKSDDGPDYSIRATLDPDINSFGYAFEPLLRRATFRVRAFYYGQPSNLAHETTGPEQTRTSDVNPEPARKAKR